LDWSGDLYRIRAFGQAAPSKTRLWSSIGPEHVRGRGDSLPLIPLRVGERWFHTFTWMDGRPQRGDISINAHMLGISQRIGAATLDPGPHPIGRELAHMLISKRSIHYQRMPQYEAILHPPAVLSPTLLQRLESEEAETVAAGT
jgi:hypothetical protein